jgi:hypothetical protein
MGPIGPIEAEIIWPNQDDDISMPSAASSERQRGIIVTNNTGIVLRLFDGVLF